MPEQYPFSASAQICLKSALKNSLPLVFPTETLYALGGNALSEALCHHVAQIKQRPRHKAFPVLLNPDILERWTQIEFPEVWMLIEHFWPGPLTLIVRSSKKCPQHLQGPHQSIAVRHSSSPVVQELIRLGQCPLIGTSANVSGFSATHRLSEIKKQFQPHVPLCIEGSISASALPSTLLNCTTFPFCIEREGAVKQEELLQVLNSSCFLA